MEKRSLPEIHLECQVILSRLDKRSKFQAQNSKMIIRGSNLTAFFTTHLEKGAIGGKSYTFAMARHTRPKLDWWTVACYVRFTLLLYPKHTHTSRSVRLRSQSHGEPIACSLSILLPPPSARLMIFADLAADIPIPSEPWLPSRYDNPLNYFCCLRLKTPVSQGPFSSCPTCIIY